MSSCIWWWPLEIELQKKTRQFWNWLRKQIIEERSSFNRMQQRCLQFRSSNSQDLISISSLPQCQAVDEIAFLSPSTSVRWLLGELHVAAARWVPDSDESDSVRSPTDAAARVVQVLPGPHASIEDASESVPCQRLKSGKVTASSPESWYFRQSQGSLWVDHCLQDLACIIEIDRN